MTEEILFGLLKDSPWIGLSAYLLWRTMASSTTALQAYKDGSEQARLTTDSLSELSRSLSSVEASLGQLHTNVDRVHTTVLEMRASR